MQNRFWMILALMTAGAVFSACTPVVVGVAGAVIVDEVIEHEQGGDGLF